MPSFKGLTLALKKVHYGLSVPSEFLLSFIDCFTYNVIGKNFGIAHNHLIKRNLKEIRRDNGYAIGEIKFPLLEKEYERLLSGSIYYSTFSSYLFFNDKYDEKTVDICDSLLGDGLYGLQNDKVNVTVEPGDIVIDAGAWIGDFAAYAANKGATAYAFEPTEKTFNYLVKTAALNKNIIPVNKGLSDKNAKTEIFIDPSDSVLNTLYTALINKNASRQNIETVRLDDFIIDNNLKHVDFIKADIQGSERNMLEGAQETLRKFAPKLALGTYHLPDDPEVMTALIKKANPNYNIVQKKYKLYASVPK